MATRSQPLIPAWLWPGLFTSILLVGIALTAFGALWREAPDIPWQALWDDSYVWYMVRFTFWQAFLSAVLSTLPAIILARALYRRHFPGRTCLLRLCSITLVLPVLVSVFGILRVYGRQGWLAKSLSAFGCDYMFSPYGLKGILLAHVFFNLPLATRLLLQALESISTEQRQLAAQLGMHAWQTFRIIEWPWLRRQIIPSAALIFTLCFASFATVLLLGGGPRATTIELAIYQALSFDYDPARAAGLALIQMFCCLGLVFLSQRLGSWFSVDNTQQLRWRNPQDSLGGCLGDALIIFAALLLLLPPLLAVMLDGLNPAVLTVLKQPALWHTLWTSLCIALGAGTLCVILTLMLLWSSRELKLRQQRLAGQLMDIGGLLILAMPSIVLATGFFLFLNDTAGLPASPYGLVVTTNALIAIPYALKILEN
ncbi:MAG: thiamine/thiamine pyrophosphate ABC transporter permease, partial [Candidatus Malihini olakiniferum]